MGERGKERDSERGVLKVIRAFQGSEGIIGISYQDISQRGAQGGLQALYRMCYKLRDILLEPERKWREGGRR